MNDTEKKNVVQQIRRCLAKIMEVKRNVEEEMREIQEHLNHLQRINDDIESRLRESKYIEDVADVTIEEFDNIGDVIAEDIKLCAIGIKASANSICDDEYGYVLAEKLHELGLPDYSDEEADLSDECASD